MRATVQSLFLLLLWSAAAVAGAAGADLRPGDRGAARRLWLLGLDRRADLDARGAHRYFRAAARADPEYLPAQYAYLMSPALDEEEWAAYLRRIAEGGGPYFSCLAGAARAIRSGYPAGLAESVLSRAEPSRVGPCAAFFASVWGRSLTPARAWRGRVLRAARRSTELNPEVAESWWRWAEELEAAGRAAEAAAALRRGVVAVPHPVHRIALYVRLADLQSRSGAPGRAAALRRALAAAVERDGRPGLAWDLAPDSGGRGRSVGPEALARWRVRLAVQAGDPHLEMTARVALGWVLGNAGNAAEALAEFDRAAALAAETGRARDLPPALTARGRMLAKLGRHREAEHALRTAIETGSRYGASHYVLAEAYHNLAHVYEGQGRMRAAAEAADRFIAFARPLRHSQPRIMSLRDAGMIRWKAGWPAAADAVFGAMVAEIDGQERHHYWAGEYLERAGDLAGALSYYRRGAAFDPAEERALNLAGLARVHRALGQADSAEAAARLHDRAAADQLTIPLLPAILAERGRMAEALRIARAWSERRAAEGNLQSAALASGQLAELLLAAGDAAEAEAQALRVEELARRGNLTGDLVLALRVRGQARFALGDTAAALRLLRRAAGLADRHPTVDAVRLSHLALADALAGAGRSLAESLAEYDRAARVVEGVLARLGGDIDRTRYRERRLAPFEGALALLMRGAPDSARLDALVRWSQRRKAASLRLALAGGGPDPPSPAPMGVAELARRLPAGSILVDFLVFDSTAAALVVSPRGARLVRLGAGPDSLARLVERIRAPFSARFAGRVDLARAEFDRRAASALSRSLLDPLGPELAGASRLVLVPDGALHRLPFAALPEPSGLRGLEAGGAPGGDGDDGLSGMRFLLDRFEIVVLPSAQFLPAAWGAFRPASAEVEVLAVAREAPGSAREIAAIRSAWSEGGTLVLEGDAATESAVREASAGRDILHLATHARANDRDPLASHLRLGADDRHDGYLHLAEVAELPGRPKLVVLSACETLDGPNAAGEGLVGLARAFLAAGARAVVATRWPVGAATAELMGAFHGAMARGEPPPAALRTAQLATRRNPATAHPFFWAGFVLVRGGEPAATGPAAGSSSRAAGAGAGRSP